MSAPIIQTSFNAGEWAPALNARVDLTKYHSGAALLRNFFVDYRGGATARAGTRYILQTKSTGTVRLIPFQASFTVSYMLEFGAGYIRFYNNGAPVLETATTISAVNIGTSTITDTGHGYLNGDWVQVAGIVGTLGAQLNGNYYIIAGKTTDTYTLTNLNGVAIVFTGAYTSGGTAKRVYIITSPYQSADLKAIKFAQNVNTLVICHPNYPPYQLVLTSATNWALSAITFGSTIGIPGSVGTSTTLSAGSVNYAYVVTAVDSSGQESGPSAYATATNITDIRSVAGSIFVLWGAVTGASSYNVYRAEPSYSNAVPVGAAFGFVGNVTGTELVDSNITPDFSQGPPVVLNPFAGAGVQTVTITSVGNFSGVVPFPTFTGGGGSGAAAIATVVINSCTLSSGGTGFTVGDTYNTNYPGVFIGVHGTSFGAITSFSLIGNSPFTSGSTVTSTLAAYPGGGFTAAFFVITWGLSQISVTSAGTGYATAPTVGGFGGNGGSATATLGASSSGNPTVPQFFQQRLILAGPPGNAQQINMSQPGAYYNFNVNNPIEADDAYQGTLVSGQLNTIQSMISQPAGLIVLSDKQAWLLNGGSPGSAVSAIGTVANSQAYNGSAGLPPIIANDNILYVQAKGSIVRDLVYNYYTAVYTGSDISVLSSHLFYGFTLLEWAWAEEPFKIVWAVRNDGALLSLTFLKEQELVAWAHSDTQGAFKSIATITEATTAGTVDAIYTVVQRSINGNTIQYIERMTELYYPNGLTDAWCVDAGIQFNGTASLSFTGAQHLAGAIVTGLATTDTGAVSIITPFAMPTTGNFTLPAPASPATGYTRVTIGLSYLPQLQTLALDLGEPTVQGKRKKISAVTVRCSDTLGLSIGRTFPGTPMKDLILGNIGTMTNQLVAGLVTGDARTIIDPLWDVPGQYCIQQSSPYPASILGVIPEIEIGDSK